MLYIRVFSLHACMWTIYVFSAQGGEKMALDPLGLEVQMVVTYCGGPWNWTWVLLQDKQVLLTAEPSL